VGEETIADKAAEAPEESGQAEAPPQDQSATDVMVEAEQEIAAGETAAEATTSEGTGDAETQAVGGADDTAMAPVTDPFIEAMRADGRFQGANFESTADFLDSVVNLRNRMSQRDEDAVLGREMRGDLDAFRKFQDTKRAEEAGQSAWSPPPKPIGIEAELQKPEAERDPVKIEAYNNHVRYVNDRQTAWAQDPDLKLREHTLPAVVRVFNEMFSERERIADVTQFVNDRKDYVNAHGREIEGIMREDGVPLKIAIELHQSRHKGKSTTAADARKADATELASGKAGPTHVPSKTKKARTAATESSGMVGLMREAEAEVGPLDD
jgi:hypothetical protein